MNRLILSSPSQPARARQGKVGVEDGINARFGGQAAGGSGKPEGSRGSNLIFRRTGEEDGLEGEEEEGLESRIKRVRMVSFVLHSLMASCPFVLLDVGRYSI